MASTFLTRILTSAQDTPLAELTLNYIHQNFCEAALVNIIVIGIFQFPGLRKFLYKNVRE